MSMLPSQPRAGIAAMAKKIVTGLTKRQAGKLVRDAYLDEFRVRGVNVDPVQLVTEHSIIPVEDSANLGQWAVVDPFDATGFEAIENLAANAVDATVRTRMATAVNYTETLADRFEQLKHFREADQTTYTFTRQQRRDIKVKMDTENKTFDEAFDEIVLGL